MRPFDANGVFRLETEVVPRLAIRGAGVTMLSSALGLGIQIISIVVLARLLAPADFGVITMVTTISLLFMNFGVNGFTEAMLQAESMDHAMASNLFWINAGIGLLLTVGFAASGSLLGRFYGDPRVAHVAIVMSVTIFITSVSVQHLALLRRAMRFSAVSINEILARIVAVATSIFLGWAGWGYWALVAGAVALALSTSTGAWTLCRWVPGLPRRAAGTGAMVRFALHTYTRFGLNYFARNVDNLLVGWRFSAPALGFYKKAYDLFALPASQTVSPLTTVAVSALSRFDRFSVQYRRYFLSTLAVAAFVGMGLAADLTLVGTDVIRLLLGPNWGPAGRIFTFFAPGIGIMLVYSTHSWIHLSIGRPDRWLRWGVVELAVTGLLFLLALSWGPVGIAAAWTTSFWILTVPAFWYAGKPINLGIGPVLRSIWRYILASLLAGVACALIMRHVQTLVAAQGAAGALAHLGISTLLFAALYAGAVIGLHGGAEPLYQMAKLLPDLVPWGRSLQSPSKEPLPSCGGLQTVAPKRSIRARLHGYYQRRAASLVFKRPLVVNPERPLISFTFDDFPRSALFTGGAILQRFGLAGTYYAALGLEGKKTPTGEAFVLDDLTVLLEQGHELGCHTFSHCHSWETDAEIFENSVIENRRAIGRLIPGAEFKSFSYPMSPPRPRTKARVADHFLCCRGGGQTLNVGIADLNHLSAYFLEQSRHCIQAVEEVIDRNRKERGWLIFATHDIAETPSPYGCTPEFFEAIVEYAVNSGAQILPVVKVLEVLGAPGTVDPARPVLGDSVARI